MEKIVKIKIRGGGDHWESPNMEEARARCKTLANAIREEGDPYKDIPFFFTAVYEDGTEEELEYELF